MEPVKTKMNKKFWSSNKSSVRDEGGPSVGQWEIRPGGMLVQKRSSDMNPSSVSTPTIRVRVKYGSSYHEISISSRASFGELKKKLAEPTGLHPEEQKLIFKNKERDSKAFLDVSRVKDGSKIILVEDIENKERRCLEMLRNANVQKVSKSLTEINSEVNKLEERVIALEQTASRLGKVQEMDVEILIEMLMTKLIQLDGIAAEGDLKQQRRMQVRRVQKNIETLDMVKLQSANSSSIEGKTHSQRQGNSTIDKSMPILKPQNKGNYNEKKPFLQKTLNHSESIVVTTKWETFD
ncbi:Molecular chaperone regulator [Parasponia andersonii]|uniref:Molecular chaperone regulator n=1 Tax=Parasponia andersonii TaxID=3476 RepID=A0A2P5CBD4_PARAD|nr:Molecular chaperone regulator [Parasponia andersonii]